MKPKKPPTDHIVVRQKEGDLFCYNCEGRSDMPPLPIDLTDFSTHLKSFVTVHRNCKPKEMLNCPTCGKPGVIKDAHFYCEDCSAMWPEKSPVDIPQPQKSKEQLYRECIEKILLVADSGYIIKLCKKALEL